MTDAEKIALTEAIRDWVRGLFADQQNVIIDALATTAHKRLQSVYDKWKADNAATIAQLTKELAHAQRRIRLLEVTAVRKPTPKTKGKGARGRVVAIDEKASSKAKTKAVRVVSLAGTPRRAKETSNHRSP